MIVKNLPWSVTWQQLKDAFREFGGVKRADVPQDRSVDGLFLLSSDESFYLIGKVGGVRCRDI